MRAGGETAAAHGDRAEAAARGDRAEAAAHGDRAEAAAHGDAAEAAAHGDRAEAAAHGDAAEAAARGGAAAAPPRLIVGVGCSVGCPPDELGALVDAALAELGGDVAAIATVDRRESEPCVVALAARHLAPLRTHGADALAHVAVPTPSDVVAHHVGTPSVAEAAALLSAGPGARLVVTKRRSAHATCAIAEVAR